MPFPPEKSSMDIVDVITRAGGFLPTAKSDAVKISHTDANGVETTSTINVEVMFSRRGTTATGMKSFMVYPGDRIWVDERLF
jgi:polysaccharide export outer membrane protein